MLRQEGLITMGDVLSPTGGLVQWADLPPRITVTRKVSAYRKLILNLHDTPIIAPIPGSHPIFFADSNEVQGHKIWQYNVAPHDLPSNWAHISTIYAPVKPLKVQVGITLLIPLSPPTPGTNLHKVL